MPFSSYLSAELYNRAVVWVKLKRYFAALSLHHGISPQLTSDAVFYIIAGHISRYRTLLPTQVEQRNVNLISALEYIRVRDPCL